MPDELVFLQRVAQGQETTVPMGQAEAAIVQILAGYQVLRTVSGQLEVTIEGFHLLETTNRNGVDASSTEGVE